MAELFLRILKTTISRAENDFGGHFGGVLGGLFGEDGGMAFSEGGDLAGFSADFFVKNAKHMHFTMEICVTRWMHF